MKQEDEHPPTEVFIAADLTPWNWSPQKQCLNMRQLSPATLSFGYWSSDGGSIPTLQPATQVIPAPQQAAAALENHCWRRVQPTHLTVHCSSSGVLAYSSRKDHTGAVDSGKGQQHKPGGVRCPQLPPPVLLWSSISVHWVRGNLSCLSHTQPAAVSWCCKDVTTPGHSTALGSPVTPKRCPALPSAPAVTHISTSTGLRTAWEGAAMQECGFVQQWLQTFWFLRLVEMKCHHINQILFKANGVYKSLLVFLGTVFLVKYLWCSLWKCT